MIDWSDLVKTLGYKNEKSMFVDLYKKNNLKDLSRQLAVSPHAVKRALLSNGVVLRKRGGPRWKVPPELMTPELMNRIHLEGLRVVAASLGISKYTLYQRKRKYAEQLLASTPSTSDAPDPEDGAQPSVLVQPALPDSE